MKHILLFLALTGLASAQTSRTANINEVEKVFKPEQYGANPNDTTDDRVAFQAAVDAAIAAGGGTVYLSEGANGYYISENGGTGYGILINGRVTLRGSGVSSRITATDATATTLLFAEGVGPYDSETTPIDHCGVYGVYFNPSVQKDDAALEVSVPYSRHFTISDIHYGRLAPLVTGSESAFESKIGSFAKFGDPLAPISSTMRARSIRGFGYYQALHNTNCVDTDIDGWLADANRANAQTFLISGHSEGLMVSNCGLVNSAVATQTATGSNLIIQPDASGTPKYNKFVNCFFDSHRYGATIEGSISTDFVNCWFNGSAGGSLGNGVVIGGALHVRFTNCSFNDTRKGGIVVNSSKFVSFTDCEVLSSNTLEFSDTPSILVNTGAQFTSFKGIRVENTGENSNSSLSMVIESGASNTTWDDSCFFRNGILDKRNLGGDVPTSGLYHWFRASHNSPLSNADLVARWTDSAPNPSGRAALVATSEAASPISRAEGYQFSGEQWMGLYNDRTDTRFYQSLGDFTLIFLAKISNDALFLGASDAISVDPNYQVRYFGTTTSSPAGTMGIYLNAGSLLESTATAADPTGWHLFEYNRSGTSLTFFVDGVQLGAAVTASTANLEFNRLGGGFGIGLPEGMIKEVMIYNRSINGTERGQITSYVQRQYHDLID